MKRWSWRGIGLGSTLVVAALLATLGFALAGLSVSHLHLQSRWNNGDHANNLAESVVADAVAELMDQDSFGQAATRAETLNLTLPNAPGEAWATLTFSPELAAEEGVPYSTNNLEGTQSKLGWNGTVVPASGIHLVGVGECNGTRRVVEAVLHRPAYPYALSSAGKIRFEGEVTVASIEGEVEVGGVLDPEAESRLLPADMASGSNDPEAIYLGSGSTVAGDVYSSGGVVVDQAEVFGQVLTSQGKIEVPSLEPADYDPQDRDHRTLQDSYDGPEVTFESAVRRQGDLTIRGDLKLDGALVYVDGDLQVEGSVTGTGALVVTGSTHVDRGAALDSSNVLAILSGGDVVLKGEGASSSYFQGLIATQGRFEANQVTVLGTLVAGGEEDVLLRDSRLFHDPDSGEFSLTIENRTSRTLLLDSNGNVANSLTDARVEVIPVFGGAPDSNIYRVRYHGDPSEEVYEFGDNQRAGGLNELQNHISMMLAGGNNAFRDEVVRDNVRFAFNRWRQGRGNPSQTTEEQPPTVLTIRPSEFLQSAQRLKIRLWRRV